MGVKGPSDWFISEPKDLQAVAQATGFLYEEVIDGGID